MFFGIDVNDNNVVNGITMTQWDGSYYFDLARSGFDSMVSCFPNGKSEMGNQFVGEYVGRLLDLYGNIWDVVWNFSGGRGCNHI